MQADIYILGKSRVPPWAKNIMSDIEYGFEGNILRAKVNTSSGVKFLQKGSVLIRVNENISVLSRQDARKYGVL